MTGGSSTRSPWCLRRMGDGSRRVKSLVTVDKFVIVKRTWNSPGQTTGESAAMVTLGHQTKFSSMMVPSNTARISL